MSAAGCPPPGLATAALVGRPTRVAEGPFDLDPAGTDWRVQYGLGSHTVLAEVTTVDGTFRRLATFDVYR